MKKEELRIVFMGTPEFAVASLQALVAEGFAVVGVVTAPDKPAGRGMNLQQSAVKKYALEKGIPVLQPEKLRNPEFLEQLERLDAHLQIVVAFRMLPQVVWSHPQMGTLNVHGSLLPQYRGAAPINWALINGEQETGVTTFKLKHEIDTGDVLLQERIPITENMTAGELHDEMKEVGAQLLVRTINGLLTGTVREVPQAKVASLQPPLNNVQSELENTLSPFTTAHSLKHAPKIFTDTCRIEWHKPVHEVHNLIRGLSPYPGAFTQLNGKMLKIFRSEKTGKNHSLKAGTVDSDGKTYLRFAAADGLINVLELQLEGKKRMMVEDFLRGYKV